MIAAITARYERLDPADASYFAARRRVLERHALARYDALRAAIRARYRGTPVGYSESVFQGLGEDLGLKLATFALLRADGEDPILILDDVFATLDAERRAALAAVARSAEQTLITAAVLDDVPGELRGARVEVGDGIAVLVKESVPAGEVGLP